MIDLMLHTDRFDPRTRLFVKGSSLILPLETNPAVALQKRGVIRKAHATLLARFGFPLLENNGIHKNETLSPAFAP